MTVVEEERTLQLGEQWGTLKLHKQEERTLKVGYYKQEEGSKKAAEDNLLVERKRMADRELGEVVDMLQEEAERGVGWPSWSVVVGIVLVSLPNPSSLFPTHFFVSQEQSSLDESSGRVLLPPAPTSREELSLHPPFFFGIRPPLSSTFVASLLLP